ncbi:MAG TPA: HAD family phosphatase [Acidimicrobiales bacterium]|jgi:HAD superfamily hydrolase (TIGR01509 family)|nr:HAD family phosphatase [Acidimicrobiales bacterium]
MSRTRWDLVVFDNDGVLVDSERTANVVLARILSELWRPTTFEDSVATYLGGSIERVRSLVESQSSRPLPDDFEDRYHRELFSAFDTGLAAVPGAAALVDALAASDLPFCVASSGSRARIERTLTQVGLWAHFERRAFSADEVVAGKPAPDLFLRAAELSGADPARTIVVEDSPLGVEAAGAAGMACIGFAAVTPGHRLTGAGAIVESMDQVEALIMAGPPLISWSGRA